MNSIPKRRQSVPLLDNANLSSGGDAVDVTGSIHPTFRRLATSLTREMGLRFCGVDLMLPEGTIEQPCDAYHVIEINAAPGLDHYAGIGKRQKLIVDALYSKVLEAMRNLP